MQAKTAVYDFENLHEVLFWKLDFNLHEARGEWCHHHRREVVVVKELIEIISTSDAFPGISENF